MPKQLRNYPIYIAPQIMGYIDRNGQAIVFDEKTRRNLDPNDIDDKILIYERQVKEWFLNRASRFLQGDKNGFIVLMISISYIEGVQQYFEGELSNNRTGEFFKNGLKRIFGLENITDNKLNDFYKQVRCGLFHSGMTRHKVIISNTDTETISFSNGDIKINPKLFLKKIKNDFNDYIKKLKNRNNTDLRANFDRMFTNLPEILRE